jgi:hypothetical protein
VHQTPELSSFAPYIKSIVVIDQGRRHLSNRRTTRTITMHIPINLLTSTLAMSVTVSASRFYQCTVRGTHTWSGINQECSQLGSNWCSTDCNWFKKNCDTCEYTARGDPPNADVAKLQNWCNKQPKFEYDRDHQYNGKLEYYTRKVYGNPCSWCGGCAYVDTCAFDAPDGQGLCHDYPKNS